MQRKRAISLYPGTAKCGIAFWIVDDDCLSAVAVGSIPLETVRSVVESFAPNLVLIEDRRLQTCGHKAGLLTLPAGTKVRRTPETWREAYLPLPNPDWGREVGVWAINALKLGFHALFQRGKGLKLREFKPVQYSRSWLDRYRRRGVEQPTKPRNHY